MEKTLTAIFGNLLLSFALINRVCAAEDSLLNQFLGSPLLALTVIVAIVIIAFLYRKIRK